MVQDADEITADPTTVHTFPQLRAELNRLRVQARPGYKGHMSFETASQRSGIPKSTLHGYLRDRQIPSDQLELLVKAMGVTEPEELRSWTLAWHRAKASTLSTTPADPIGPESVRPDNVELDDPGSVTASDPPQFEPLQADDTEPAVRTDTSSRWRPGRLLIATAVVLLLAAVITGVVIAPRWMRSAPTTDNRTAEIVFQDDFGDEQLDITKWAQPAKPHLIKQKDGRMNFVVTAADSAKEVTSELLPLGAGHYREVGFTISVPAYTQSGDGGVWLSMSEESGRTSRIAFGPSAEGGASLYALFCSKPRCDSYQDFDTATTYFNFPTGAEVPVRVTDTDGHLRLYARNNLVAVGPQIDTTLTAFRFVLYAAESESWHITVDSLRVMS